MAKPIPDTYETRDCLVADDGGAVELLPVETRAASDANDRPGFDGYITTWNTVDSYGTAFAPGAFRKTIKERVKVAPILVNHDYWGGLPIGRHVAAAEDDRGVRISAAISETNAGQDALRLLRDGVPLGLSFGFDRIADRSATEKDQLDLTVAPDYIKSLPVNELRVITEVRWWESSLATFPANAKAKPDTIRSLADLPTLLDAIKANQLTDEQRALAEQIVAAWSERAAAGGTHGTRTDPARPRFDVHAALATARLMGLAA